jgi:Fic family protein
MDLQLINTDLLSAYQAEAGNLSEKFDALKDAEISTGTFSFYTSVASVFSSKIEGVEIELDSYVKHKHLGVAFKPDYTKKTDDLYNAYIFAQNNTLNQKNIVTMHQLLSKNIVAAKQQGKLRTQNMYVSTPDGKIEYIAISPYELETEMEKFYSDISILLKQKMTIEETFFYAAHIHLVFVKIHPWNDGNGRSGRLLEKWFLAQKLGEKAWYIQSEKYYYNQHQTYYTNLRKLGLEYPELDYTQALPFLLMLPKGLAF